MKNKFKALLLSCMLFLFISVTGCAISEIAEADLVGTWDGTIIVNQFMPKSLMVYLMEDGTGSYIDTTDEEILASGMAAQVSWNKENDQLVLTYANNPKKQIHLSLVFNNGFVNLLSDDGITLTRKATANEPQENTAERNADKPAEIRVQDGVQTVLTDNQGIKISLTGKYDDASNVINLETIIENNSDLSVKVRAYPIANGWEANSSPLMGQAVSSGAKGKRPLYLFKEEISANTYQELQTLKLTFVIQDEFGNQLFKQNTGTIYFDDHIAASAAPKENICTEEELLGEWIEIHHQDMMRLHADGSGDNSYIKYRSATAYSSYDQEMFDWEISGDQFLVTEKNNTFREKLGGKMTITLENDEWILSQGELVYKKVRQPIKLKMGEKAETDMMTFVPSRYSYASRVDDIIQPTKSGIMYSPGDGRTWAIVHYKVSSPNRETIGGKQWQLSLDHKNGIIYKGNDNTMHYIEGNRHKLNFAPDFTSSSMIEGRTGFKVPEKMPNDKSSPLKLIVRLPSKEYGYQTFEYDIIR